jgi:hypothetical protein
MTPSERVASFATAVDRMLDRRLVQDGSLSINFTLEWQDGGPLQVNVVEPDEEDLRSFLLDFRKFVSKKEALYVDRVHNELYRAVDDPGLRAELDRAKQLWRSARRRGAIHLVVDDDQFAPEQLLDLWINGRYFHDDDAKQRELARLEAAEPMARLARHAMLDLVIEATKYLRFLRDLIRHAEATGALPSAPG